MRHLCSQHKSQLGTIRNESAFYYSNNLNTIKNSAKSERKVYSSWWYLSKLRSDFPRWGKMKFPLITNVRISDWPEERRLSINTIWGNWALCGKLRSAEDQGASLESHKIKLSLSYKIARNCLVLDINLRYQNSSIQLPRTVMMMTW